MTSFDPYITQVIPAQCLVGPDQGPGPSPAELASPIFDRFVAHALSLWQAGHYSEARREIADAIEYARESGLSKGQVAWVQAKFATLHDYLSGFDWRAEECRRVARS